jgi:hypothetical protein
MAIKRIKIAYQRQANKPIYLMSTGVIGCGRFNYRGRYKALFKTYFSKMCGLVHDGSEVVGEYDVSEYKYWNAINIYNDYIVADWVASIDADQIERLANETEVAMMSEEIKNEFVRAVGSKWKRIFKRSDPDDPQTPTKAWQIF